MTRADRMRARDSPAMMTMIAETYDRMAMLAEMERPKQLTRPRVRGESPMTLPDA